MHAPGAFDRELQATRTSRSRPASAASNLGRRAPGRSACLHSVNDSSSPESSSLPAPLSKHALHYRAHRRPSAASTVHSAALASPPRPSGRAFLPRRSIRAIPFHRPLSREEATAYRYDRYMTAQPEKRSPMVRKGPIPTTPRRPDDLFPLVRAPLPNQVLSFSTRRLSRSRAPSDVLGIITVAAHPAQYETHRNRRTAKAKCWPSCWPRQNRLGERTLLGGPRMAPLARPLPAGRTLGLVM